MPRIPGKTEQKLRQLTGKNIQGNQKTGGVYDLHWERSQEMAVKPKDLREGSIKDSDKYVRRQFKISVLNVDGSIPKKRDIKELH